MKGAIDVQWSMRSAQTKSQMIIATAYHENWETGSVTTSEFIPNFHLLVKLIVTGQEAERAGARKLKLAGKLKLAWKLKLALKLKLAPKLKLARKLMPGIQNWPGSGNWLGRRRSWPGS